MKIIKYKWVPDVTSSGLAVIGGSHRQLSCNKKNRTFSNITVFFINFYKNTFPDTYFLKFDFALFVNATSDYHSLLNFIQ